ncbi:hypothetical protein [Oceanobacillus sp. CF4.6]|uniref:hypothetical protein n=1 Tax=Oceanobacillus sp. CF4.6 TaxID=3373080 RepID=UPI003EE673A5
MDDAKADKLHKQIYDTKQQINSRNRKMEILKSQDNPNLKDAASETIKAVINERDKHLQQVNDIEGKLAEVKQQYFALCNQLEQNNRSYESVRTTAQYAAKVADWGELPKQVKMQLNDYSKLSRLSDLKILNNEITNYVFKGGNNE